MEAGKAAESIYTRLKDQAGEARVLLEIVAKLEVLKGEPAVVSEMKINEKADEIDGKLMKINENTMKYDENE